MTGTPLWLSGQVAGVCRGSGRQRAATVDGVTQPSPESGR
jgi:hypothetical protein